MSSLSLQRVQEYKSRLNRVMDYIEANLEKDFGLEELARVACFSKFHFHRIFRSLTQETLFSFIQRLRLERAAGLLSANRDMPVTSIALDCGFSGSASFARAFKGRFGMTASKWRRMKQTVYSREKKDLIRPENDLFSRLQAQMQVRDMEPMTLAYIRYTGPYEGDSELFEKLYHKLYKWASPRGFVSEKTMNITVYHDHIDVTDQEKLRISVSITVPPETEVTGEIGKMALSGGRYACARFHLTSSDYYDAWQWVFSGWLPKSGYQPGDGPGFEYFPFIQKEAGSTGKLTVDICIPVKPL
jgi:AraC family transcriptional regulator